MGVLTTNIEFPSSIPPAKLYKAFVLELDNLIPKVLPGIINDVQLEGDGGPGTIKQITFGEGVELRSMKHKIDAIDKQNLIYKYSIIEGDALMGVFEKISCDVKVEATPNGGSIYKNNSAYHSKNDAKVADEQLNINNEKALGIFKAVEAYVLANPDALN